MPRVRFHIRALIAVVAVVAVVSAGVVLTHRRSQAFRDRASYHAAASHQLEMEARFWLCGFGISPERIEQTAREWTADKNRQRSAAEYHRRLSVKYQAAAARPWYPVSSDPPPPPLANPKLVSADDY